MPRKLTKEEKQARKDHFDEHRGCWLCMFLNRRPMGRIELHHIAGRGKQHETRENYTSLCNRCHTTVQSQKDAELICLVLVRDYSPDNYSPETICDLRGRADSCWTDVDVERCSRIMRIMQEVLR